MLLSDETQKATKKYIDEELDPAHIALLQNLTVRLGGGVASGTFTGSGVVFRVDTVHTYILTAKHNLHIAAKGAGKAVHQLADYFKLKIKAELRDKSGTKVEANIVDVTFPDGSAEDYKYDVCLLKIGGTYGQAFTAAARSFLAPDQGLTWLFTSMNWQRHRDKADPKPPLWNVLTPDDAAEVLANGHDSPFLRSGYVLVQLGHGRTVGPHSDTMGFRTRVMKLADIVADSEFIAETKEKYVNVFTFPSSDTDTALTGDSGGPVFAIDKTGTQSWLIGVHLGANFYKNKIDNDAATENNAFSVLTTTSLGIPQTY